MQAAAALLSPGGDGGVLVLDGMNLSDAATVAGRLQSLTEIASLDHAEAITVATRIGVHYGHVANYTNARGIQRPTGLSVFIADEIAGDEYARSCKGIIVTRLVADTLAGGSNQRLNSEFEILPKVTPRRGIAIGNTDSGLSQADKIAKEGEGDIRTPTTPDREDKDDSPAPFADSRTAIITATTTSSGEAEATRKSEMAATAALSQPTEPTANTTAS
jgi:hypothetical protein